MSSRRGSNSAIRVKRRLMINRPVKYQGRSHFPGISSLVHRLTGTGQSASSVIRRLGKPEPVYLAGEYTRGLNPDSLPIEEGKPI